MVRTKLVPRRVKIRRWPPRQPAVKFKIKTILPEQKTIDIKKNGQVIRTINLQIGGPDSFNFFLKNKFFIIYIIITYD